MPHVDPAPDVHDVLSDEIEVARAATQLAANLVDTLGVAPAAHIDVLDVLPLYVLLNRHVASLEEIEATLNALSFSQ